MTLKPLHIEGLKFFNESLDRWNNAQSFQNENCWSNINVAHHPPQIALNNQQKPFNGRCALGLLCERPAGKQMSASIAEFLPKSIWYSIGRLYVDRPSDDANSIIEPTIEKPNVVLVESLNRLRFLPPNVKRLTEMS